MEVDPSVKRRLLPVLLLAAALAAQASAHSILSGSDPAPGAVVFLPEGGEGVLRLWFTERVEPAFSAVEVRDASGARVDVSGSLKAGGNGAEVTVAVRPSSLGTHTVNYRMLSAVDGHTMSGSYSFVVAWAAPGPGSRLAASPEELRFEVPKELQVSEFRVALYRGSGRLLEESVALRDGQSSDVARLQLPPLADGVYEVRWEMATSQGKKSGQYQFAIGR